MFLFNSSPLPVRNEESVNEKMCQFVSGWTILQVLGEGSFGEVSHFKIGCYAYSGCELDYVLCLVYGVG